MKNLKEEEKKILKNWTYLLFSRQKKEKQDYWNRFRGRVGGYVLAICVKETRTWNENQ